MDDVNSNFGPALKNNKMSKMVKEELSLSMILEFAKILNNIRPRLLCC